MTGALILIAVLFAQPASAGVGDAPTCPVPAGVQARAFPAEIPQPLLSALKEKYGTFAGPKEAFNSSDVIYSGAPPQRRVAFAWQRGTRWVFATEHGGIGYNVPVLAYELDAAGAKADFLTEDLSFGKTLCEIAGRRIAAQN